MKCPNCNKKTIRFREWAKGLNAFLWQCPHCRKELTANTMTYIMLVIGVVLVFSILVTADNAPLPEALNIGNFNDLSSGIKQLILGAALIPFAFLSYFYCGYRKPPGK